jgi:hypothetical protein
MQLKLQVLCLNSATCRARGTHEVQLGTYSQSVCQSDVIKRESKKGTE